jgi:CO/xanthine dehydrogenase FAD-binding subunit
VRRAAASALDRPADKVVTADRFRLPDANGVDSSEVAQRRRHDAAVLDAMLGLAKSQDVHERRLAYAALADFPSSSVAIEALHVGQHDSDGQCQLIAEHSLNLIFQRSATTRP